mgnify:CR=1 FL=1
MGLETSPCHRDDWMWIVSDSPIWPDAELEVCGWSCVVGSATVPDPVAGGSRSEPAWIRRRAVLGRDGIVGALG